MLHLRRAGLLDTAALTVSGLHARRAARRSGNRRSAGPRLRAAAARARRRRSRRCDHVAGGGGPARADLDVLRARRQPRAGRIGHQEHRDRSVGASTPTASIASPARRKVFVTEPDAIAAIKAGRIQAGDVLVLICRGPLGAGMEETYQLTSALKYLPFGKHVALLTDARFSGVSTGACIGHVSPEALAGGPIGKLRDGDLVEIVVDRVNGSKARSTSSAKAGVHVGAEAGARILERRMPRPDLARRSRLAGRHPAVGRAAGRQRRRLGRQRLRRRRHPQGARPPARRRSNREDSS